MFDNGRRGRTITGANKRPLKSLSDMLKGKQGRFRQNLLGKRVDYSGRSVIVTGPELKLHQCGLPKKMALELFKPFIYARLDAKGLSMTLKQAKKWVEKERKEVWDILDEVIREHPVLLNRAPTLHRLGIQAFEPVLIEGKAIQLHPLVCSAFNADFDGDQMAVHVPLSLEAQLEARVLMMSTNNILSPANGKPIIVPSQDMVLGLYYLSMMKENEPGEGMLISDMSEVHQALNAGAVTLHTKITSRVPQTDEKGKTYLKRFETTPGRMLLGETLPKSSKVPFETVNRLLTKKDVGDVIDEVYRHTGQKETVLFADAIMALGFRHAFKAGISFGKDDMLVAPDKDKLVDETREQVKDYEQQYQDGLITQQEKYNKVIDAWSRCGDQVANSMMNEIKAVRKLDNGREKDINSIYMMAHSGARGSQAQIKQLAGMRGLMAKPSGEIIETPIISNFKEGLTVLEYFNSTHGARKGLADTALKTANSGYLTRRLVDVSQDCVIIEEDCGTERALEMKAIVQGGSTIASLGERILGRTTAEDVVDAKTGKPSSSRRARCSTRRWLRRSRRSGVQGMKIRSPLVCESKIGVCGKCYGRDLARGTPVNIGEAVGVIAAQSIGEPGTQLTMRTFHIGGAAQLNEQSNLEAPVDGTAQFRDLRLIEDQRGRRVVLSRSGEIAILDMDGRELAVHRIPYGAYVMFDDGHMVSKGDRMAEWDPFTMPVITETGGTVKYVDLTEGKTLTEQTDEATGIAQRVVIEYRDHQVEGGSASAPDPARRGHRAKPARYMLASGRGAVGGGQRTGAGGRRAGPRQPRKRQDARHHRRSAARRRAVRGTRPQGLGDHRQGLGTSRVRQGLQGQAQDRHPARGWRRGCRVSGAQVEGDRRSGRRLRQAWRQSDRRQPRSARHPGDDGDRAAGRVSRVGDPGGLSTAGREDQRQAHRDDRPPDAAEGRDHRRRRHHPAQGRAGRSRGDGRDQRQARQERPACAGQARPARHHQGVVADPQLHLGGVVPGDHPRPHRGGGPGQAGHADGPQGERHRRPADPGGHGRGHEPPARGGDQPRRGAPCAATVAGRRRSSRRSARRRSMPPNWPASPRDDTGTGSDPLGEVVPSGDGSDEAAGEYLND